MTDGANESTFIDQLALQTRLLRSIQSEMGEIRLQYTQTKSCESMQRTNLTKAIDALSNSTNILSELILEYRNINANKLKKYFAVCSGPRQGIYTSWTAAQEQVRDDPNRVLGCFDSYPEAQRFIACYKQQQELESKPLEDFAEMKISGPSSIAL